MPRRVLEYYLAHAATAQWICFSDTLEDDIRVILKAGIKFLGRATGIWKAELPDPEHFERTRRAAERIHAADPEIILQACIFETVYREDLESVRIPAYVFEAFGLEPEDRCFRWEDCTLVPGEHMPDISKTETQMWFYYRAVNYIDCGCEAFHSDACPGGYSQEDAAAALLREGYGKYRALANPSDLLDYGGRDIDDPETGVRLPEKVVLYGSFQPYVGVVANDSNSEITRMYYVGNGTYALAFVMPFAGTYDFGISTWGTLSACVSENRGYPYSGSGGKSPLTIPHDNTVVRIEFTYMTNEISVKML